MKGKKVIVLENDFITALAIKQILGKNGSRVTAIVKSEADLLKQLAKELPDLIVADIGLERKSDGLDIAKICFQQFRIPILFVSVLSDRRLIESVRANKFFRFVQKPFFEAEFMTAFSELSV